MKQPIAAAKGSRDGACRTVQKFGLCIRDCQSEAVAHRSHDFRPSSPVRDNVAQSVRQQSEAQPLESEVCVVQTRLCQFSKTHRRCAEVLRMSGWIANARQHRPTTGCSIAVEPRAGSSLRGRSCIPPRMIMTMQLPFSGRLSGAQPRPSGLILFRLHWAASDRKWALS
jgi:hypothetical protein